MNSLGGTSAHTPQHQQLPPQQHNPLQAAAAPSLNSPSVSQPTAKNISFLPVRIPSVECYIGANKAIWVGNIAASK